jgi:hypothetical protein
VAHLFDDPQAVVRRDLGDADSHAYELLVVSFLREWMMVDREEWLHPGVVIIDNIELVGMRPDTQVLFRYHHRPHVIEKDAGLGPGPLAEAARGFGAQRRPLGAGGDGRSRDPRNCDRKCV